MSIPARLILGVIVAAIGMQVVAMLSIVSAQSGDERRASRIEAELRGDSARMEEKVRSIDERVKGIESANLRVRVAVIEAQLEETRKVNMGVIGGILTLLLGAGYQIKVSMSKSKGSDA